MAITATIALSKASVMVNQPVSAALTISNSGGSPVQVNSVTPFTRATGSSDPTTYNSGVALGQALAANGQNLTVPASGSLTLPFQVVPFSTTGTGTMDVFALVQTSDGANTEPTPATLTVTPFYQASPIG